MRFKKFLFVASSTIIILVGLGWLLPRMIVVGGNSVSEITKKGSVIKNSKEAVDVCLSWGNKPDHEVEMTRDCEHAKQVVSGALEEYPDLINILSESLRLIAFGRSNYSESEKEMVCEKLKGWYQRDNGGKEFNSSYQKVCAKQAADAGPPNQSSHPIAPPQSGSVEK